MKILTIEKEVQINASPTIVFEAITDPNKIISYYPIDTVRSERKVGGSIVYSGKNDGHIFTDYGTIEAFDSPHEFRYSYWSDNHGTLRTQENHMTIQYLLSGNKDLTMLILKHKNLLTDERKTMMTNVWEFLLNQLKTYTERA